MWQGQLYLRQRRKDTRPTTTLYLWLAPSLPFENSTGQKPCIALYTRTAQLWQTEHPFLSNGLTLPTRYGKSFRNKHSCQHPDTCYFLHDFLFTTFCVCIGNERHDVPHCIINNKYVSAPQQWLRIFGFISNTMNNRHQRQSVINFVSWMKSTEMGLVTYSMRRPVNISKTLRFREYIFQKIKFYCEFRLRNNFKSDHKFWNWFCVQVYI